MRRQLRQELKRIHHESRATFVHVTHDVEEAMVLGDRIGVMLAGRIHQIGSPVELSQNPTSREVADFLELRNVFTVSSYESEVCEVDGVRIHVGPRAGRVRHLWIRPEEILLSRALFQSSARNQFGCVVEGWEFQSALVSVKAALDCLNLHVSVTYASFKELGVERGGKLYATFKSSAIHCF
jgi:molybdate/tungstate transport system ATP-binding protein